MTGRVRRRGAGTLHIVAGLLVASALVRVAAEAGPALANPVPAAVESSAIPDGTAADTNSLLAAFQAREDRLNQREAQLRERIEALRLAEAEIDGQLQALREAEASLSATIALADSAAQTDLAQLTAVYENMKPKEAAALFQEMSPAFAAGFLSMMRPDVAAQIMTELSPETAYSFSVVLAGRNANVPTQ